MKVNEFIEMVRSGWERDGDEESTPYLADVLHACKGSIALRTAYGYECDVVMIDTPEGVVGVLVSPVDDEVHSVVYNEQDEYAADLEEKWNRFEELVLALRVAVLPSKIVALCAEVVALGLDKA